jgi:hypothetical protein
LDDQARHDMRPGGGRRYTWHAAAACARKLLPGRHVQRGDDGHGAVTDVLELPPGHPPAAGWPSGMLAVLGLDAGLLVDVGHQAFDA